MLSKINKNTFQSAVRTTLDRKVEAALREEKTKIAFTLMDKKT